MPISASQCEVCDDTNASIHCQECRRKTCEECDEILHLVEANKSHYRVSLFPTRSSQNSRPASFAPSRSLSPRGYEDKQHMAQWEREHVPASILPDRNSSSGYEDKQHMAQWEREHVPASILPDRNSLGSDRPPASLSHQYVPSDRFDGNRPYSAQPQRDFYQPQEAIVKTAAPLASRNASSPNPPQPDYSPAKRSNYYTPGAVDLKFGANYNEEPYIQSYSDQNRNSYTYQGFSDPGFQQQEPQQHRQYAPAQAQSNIPNSSGGLMSGSRGSYPANTLYTGASYSGAGTPAGQYNPQMDRGRRSMTASGANTPIDRSYASTGGAIPLQQWTDNPLSRLSQPAVLMSQPQQHSFSGSGYMTPVQTHVQRQSSALVPPSDPEAMHAYAQHMSALEQHRAVEAHQQRVSLQHQPTRMQSLPASITHSLAPSQAASRQGTIVVQKNSLTYHTQQHLQQHVHRQPQYHQQQPQQPTRAPAVHQQQRQSQQQYGYSHVMPSQQAVVAKTGFQPMIMSWQAHPQRASYQLSGAGAQIQASSPPPPERVYSPPAGYGNSYPQQLQYSQQQQQQPRLRHRQ